MQKIDFFFISISSPFLVKVLDMDRKNEQLEILKKKNFLFD